MNRRTNWWRRMAILVAFSAAPAAIALTIILTRGSHR